MINSNLTHFLITLEDLNKMLQLNVMKLNTDWNLYIYANWHETTEKQSLRKILGLESEPMAANKTVLVSSLHFWHHLFFNMFIGSDGVSWGDGSQGKTACCTSVAVCLAPTTNEKSGTAVGRPCDPGTGGGQRQEHFWACWLSG